MTAGKLRLTTRPLDHLRVLVTEINRDGPAHPGGRPGLIEELEKRIDGIGDARVREQLLKCLSEP